MGMFGKLLKRILLPHHWYKIYKLQKNRKRGDRSKDDAQLKLYHEILPGDFLHYGYFENPNTDPLDISLRMIYKAQENYAHKIVHLIRDKTKTVLDVGCGMGGLLGIMNLQGIISEGITPDINQIKHINSKYPNRVYPCRFEDFTEKSKKYGTIITSESLQYLNLSESLPLIDTLLEKEGIWIACDYFKTGSEGEKSGHNYALFEQSIQKSGFIISYTEDITSHILPTIAYIYHWATRIGMPVKEFLISKLKVKAPGIYYIIEEVWPDIEHKMDKNINTVDPVLFSANKRYLLMVIERRNTN